MFHFNKRRHRSIMATCQPYLEIQRNIRDKFAMPISPDSIRRIPLVFL